MTEMSLLGNRQETLYERQSRNPGFDRHRVKDVPFKSLLGNYLS